MTDESVPRSESSISSSVLVRALQGDDLAFQRICALYGGLVYHWCRKAGVTPEDAEDIGQQVFVSVIRNLPKFRRSQAGDSFRGWLRVITRSRIQDFFRDNKGKVPAQGGPQEWLDKIVEPPTDSESVDDRAQESVILYQQALNLVKAEFSEQDNQAFSLVVIEELSAKEAAERLGISVNSVYIAKSRILKRLRDEFDEVLEPELP